MIGQMISHYKVLEKLGEGGMGVVYKAEDTTLKRTVALKFLPQHVSSSETDKARFLLEAQATAALNHPNICTIYAIEEHEGQIFIAMELIEGQTLKEKHGTVTLQKAIEIGIQVAEGLSAAHEKGIVHRDIKPENIMVRKDGLVQIMDFGLAKLRASRASRLTKEGSTVGTAGFMSPEQVQGQETDHRSDIFSFGVLLYELFTGELPFKGVHETALLYEIVNVDPAPMITIKPEIDPELDRIVLECLQKEPDERYNSVKDIAKDLKRFKRESSRQRASRITSVRSIPSLQPSSTANQPAVQSGFKRWVWPIVFLVSILVVSGTLLKIFSGNQSVSKDVIKFDVTLPSDQQLGQYLDVSPDGKKIAYVARGNNFSGIYLRDISETEAHPITGTDGAFVVFFPPKGDWIGFFEGAKLKRISLRGGSPVTIAAVDNLRGADVGDDNTIIYSPNSTSALWRISADGGVPQAVTTLDSSAGEINHRYPEVLPGSKAVLFTVKTNSITKFSEAKIAVQRLDGSKKKILIEGGSFAKYIPSGHLLYGQGGSLYAVGFDPDRLELLGSPVRVLDGGMFYEGFGSMILGVSQTGTLAFAPGGPFPQDSNEVVVYDRKGNVRPLIATPGPYASVAVSPDRQRLATYIVAANDDIWLYDISRELRTRFTFAGGDNWFPQWSPDGKHVVYTAERQGGAPNLFWKPTDGSGTEERLARGPNVQFATSWSTDGKFLAFYQANEAGNSDVWILPMDGDKTPHPFLHSAFNEGWPSFSPDGHWLAYESDESGRAEIYAVPYPAGNGKWHISTGGGSYPAWRKNGSEIIYLDDTHNFMGVPITATTTLQPGSAKKLFQLPDFPLWAPDVSADGEQIAVALPGKHLRLTKFVVVVNWFEELKKKLAEK